MKQYRYLEQGEIVKEGDEVDVCAGGYKDEPKWVKTTCVGDKAPYPSFMSHRRYRREVL